MGSERLIHIKGFLVIKNKTSISEYWGCFYVNGGGFTYREMEAAALLLGLQSRFDVRRRVEMP
jgi:hypothetical protein